MVTFTITNKNRPTATVVMLVSLYGKQYRKSIGVGIPPEQWNANKNRARSTAANNNFVVNNLIDKWEEIGKQAEKYFRESFIKPTQAEFMSYISSISATSENSNDNLIDYLQNIYIPRYSAVRAVNTVKMYRSAHNKLSEFEKKTRTEITFQNIDITMYNMIRAWFMEQNYTANYFGFIVKIIKQAYAEARDIDHLHNLRATSNKKFATISETPDNIYLNKDEVDRITHCDLSMDVIRREVPNLQNIKIVTREINSVRNMFIIGCHTGLRFSDISTLTPQDFGRHLKIKTKKTGADVIIPIHPEVRRIIDEGFDFYLPSNTFNKHIKTICKMSGIDDDVVKHVYVKGVKTPRVFKKYELVSSHTARRSFATNAYKAGVPTIAIMKMTGHTSEKSFLKYIKVSEEESAESLNNHPFFC